MANKRSTPPAPQPGRFAYEGLQRTFHEKARLGIMTSLIACGDGLSFNELKELCALSDGNLNRHLEVLREAGFIEVDRSGSGRTARTRCIATKLGRQQFDAYLAELRRVLSDASAARVANPASVPARRGAT